MTRFRWREVPGALAAFSIVLAACVLYAFGVFILAIGKILSRVRGGRTW